MHFFLYESTSELGRISYCDDQINLLIACKHRFCWNFSFFIALNWLCECFFFFAIVFNYSNANCTVLINKTEHDAHLYNWFCLDVPIFNRHSKINVRKCLYLCVDFPFSLESFFEFRKVTLRLSRLGRSRYNINRSGFTKIISFISHKYHTLNDKKKCVFSFLKKTEFHSCSIVFFVSFRFFYSVYFSFTIFFVSEFSSLELIY